MLLNKSGPGPGSYNTSSSIWKQQRQSIPRADRGIVKLPKKTCLEIELDNLNSTARKSSKTLLGKAKEKTPIAYCSPEKQIELTCKQSSKAIIGDSKNRFNIRKMNALNDNLWKKGMIF